MPQWSLRTLLIATAIVPVAIYVIAKSTPFYISAVATVAAFGWIAVAIAAWVSSGSRQAWARGAILAATTYGALVVWMGTELDLGRSQLATSQLLQVAKQAFTPRIIISEDPEEDLGLRPVFKETVRESPTRVSSPTGVATFVTMPHFVDALPINRNFAIIGHIYWGAVFGLVGGCFAQWLVQHEQPGVVTRTSNGTLE